MVIVVPGVHEDVRPGHPWVSSLKMEKLSINTYDDNDNDFKLSKMTMWLGWPLDNNS